MFLCMMRMTSVGFVVRTVHSRLAAVASRLSSPIPEAAMISCDVRCLISPWPGITVSRVR